MIFWFAGFIALAVFLGDRLCYGDVCSAAKAADVFAAFEWYVLSGFLSIKFLRPRSGRRYNHENCEKARLTIWTGLSSL